MSRNFNSLAFAAAGVLTLAGTTLGGAGDLIPVQPVNGNFEFVGNGVSGVALIDVGFGNVGAATDVSAGTGADVISLQYYDSTGAAIPGAVVLPRANYSEVCGNGDDNIDDNEVWEFNVAPLLPSAPASAYCFDVIFADSGGGTDSLTINTDGVPGDNTGDRNDSTDKRFTIVRSGATLTGALVDIGANPAAATLYLTFGFPDVGNGGTSSPTSLILTLKTPDRTLGGVYAACDPYANPDDTPDDGSGPPPLANLDSTSIQIADDAGFSVNLASLPISAAGQLPDGQQFLSVTFDSTTTPVTGKYVRANASAATDRQIRDESGVLPSNGVQAGTLAPLAVTKVAFKKKISGGTATDAMAVTFNRALASAGNSTYYNGLRFLENGSQVDPGGLNPTGTPTISAGDPTTVLVDISGASSSSDYVQADGLSTGSGGDPAASQPQLNYGASGTPPSPLFGSSAAPTGTADIVDEIPPSIIGVAIYDQDNDGAIDGALAVIDEPIMPVSSTSGFELTSLNGVNTRPFYMVDPKVNNGALPAAVPTVNSSTLTENVIPITAATTLNLDANRNGTNDDREMNNAIGLWFDPYDYDWNHNGTTRNSGTPDSTEPLPDTAAYVFNLFYNATGGSQTNANSTNSISSASAFQDAHGNAFVGTSVFQSNANTDYAPPALVAVCYYGAENMPSSSSNNQQIFETNGVGDNATDRMAIIAGENFNNINSGTLDESLISVGSTGTTFSSGDFLHNNPANAVTMYDNNGNVGTALRPGNTSSAVFDYNQSSTFGLKDGSNNQLTFSGQTIKDGNAPFVEQVLDVNQNPQSSAFLVPDVSGDFAGGVDARFSQAMEETSIDPADFGVNFGGNFSAAMVDPIDPHLVHFTLGGNPIGINNTVQFTYFGANAGASLVRSQDPPAGTGVPVSAITQSINILKLQQPYRDSRDVAIMDVTGTFVDENGSPVPLGTKIYAFSAIPIVRSITATHNNIPFTYTADDTVYGPSGFGFNGDCPGFLNWLNWPNFQSIDAFTNWLQGIPIGQYVYLHRDECNNQFFTNSKTNQAIGAYYSDQPDVAPAQPNTQASANAVLDTIAINVRTGGGRGLGNISFTGNGETRDDSVKNGSLTLGWDVIRNGNSSAPGLIDYYQYGYNITGSPVVMGTTVIDNANGTFSMHVSQPTSAFNGIDRLDSVDRPVIFLAEFPDGTRCALSSLLLSATSNDADGDGVIGDAILFSSNQLRQQNDGSVSTTVLNFDLRRVGKTVVYPEWNVIPMNRTLGVATSNRGLPTFPAGVVSDDIITYNTSNLPGVTPLDAATYWTEGTRDGIWNGADDYAGFFSSLHVDVNLISHFAFTMTTQGIKLGSGMDTLVPGYAVGFFNNASVPFNPTDFGVNMFGEALSQNAVFSSNPITGNTRNSTQGWILGAVTTDHADPTSFFAANPGANYVIVFRNMGRGPSLGSTTGTSDVLIDVRSADTTGPNDLEEIGNEGAFIHYDN